MKFAMSSLHYVRENFKVGKKRRLDLRRGLTLIELAIVILVLGVIMGIVYANLNPGEITQKAKKLQVKAMATTLEAHLNRYEIESEILSDGAPLTVLTQRSENWRGIKEEQVMDSWKRPYFLCLDQSSTRQICSYGADGVPGGSGENQDFYLTDQSSWPKWLKSGK